MPRYFFDTRDNEITIQDDVGMELDNLKAVQIEASRGVADLAKDLLPGSIRRTVAIEVRDAANDPVLKAVLVFEVYMLVGD